MTEIFCQGTALRGLPTLIAFGNGKEVRRHAGALSLAELRSLLESSGGRRFRLTRRRQVFDLPLFPYFVLTDGVKPNMLRLSVPGRQ